MENQIAYAFDTAQRASRFLTHLKSGTVEGVRARLYKGSSSVIASYYIDSKGEFDTTCSSLDELAASLDGIEVSIS